MNEENDVGWNFENGDPQILKEKNGVKCWQVTFFGEKRVGLRRGGYAMEISRENMFKKYDVVC